MFMMGIVAGSFYCAAANALDHQRVIGQQIVFYAQAINIVQNGPAQFEQKKERRMHQDFQKKPFEQTKCRPIQKVHFKSRRYR